VLLLKAAKISPLVMVTLFEKLGQSRQKSDRKDNSQHTDTEPNKPAAKDSENSWLGIAFSSHPADAERIAFFKNAASAP
jgi:Zn-dependent protease with chaperone function